MTLRARTGSLLVHAQHGLMRVTARHQRPHGNKPSVPHIELRTVETHRDPADTSAGLTLIVPADSMATLGLRRPVDSSEAREMLDTLTEPTSAPHSNFARRTDNWKGMLTAGDPWGAVAALRGIHRRNTTAGRLSPGEHQLARQAERAVTAEIAAATGRTIPNVRQDIQQRLAQAAEHYTAKQQA